jgi:hypothetical protein
MQVRRVGKTSLYNAMGPKENSKITWSSNPDPSGPYLVCHPRLWWPLLGMMLRWALVTDTSIADSVYGRKFEECGKALEFEKLSMSFGQTV